MPFCDRLPLLKSLKPTLIFPIVGSGSLTLWISIVSCSDEDESVNCSVSDPPMVPLSKTVTVELSTFAILNSLLVSPAIL